MSGILTLARIGGAGGIVAFRVDAGSAQLLRCVGVQRRTIDRRGEEIELITKGRHDPCVGIRAVPIAEAMAACVILDHLLLDRAQTGGQRGRIG